MLADAKFPAGYRITLNTLGIVAGGRVSLETRKRLLHHTTGDIALLRNVVG